MRWRRARLTRVVKLYGDDNDDDDELLSSFTRTGSDRASTNDAHVARESEIMDREIMMVQARA
jgi:hypothetical protein